MFGHAISFFPASADAAELQKEFTSALAPSPEAIEKIGQYFHEKTAELISASSCPLINTNSRSVNIVRDVLKLVPVYWAASEIVRMLCIRRGVLIVCCLTGWHNAQGQTSFWCLYRS